MGRVARAAAMGIVRGILTKGRSGCATVSVFVGGPCDRSVRSSRTRIDSSSWSKPSRSIAFRLPYPPCPGATGPR